MSEAITLATAGMSEADWHAAMNPIATAIASGEFDVGPVSTVAAINAEHEQERQEWIRQSLAAHVIAAEPTSRNPCPHCGQPIDVHISKG